QWRAGRPSCQSLWRQPRHDLSCVLARVSCGFGWATDLSLAPHDGLWHVTFAARSRPDPARQIVTWPPEICPARCAAVDLNLLLRDDLSLQDRCARELQIHDF